MTGKYHHTEGFRFFHYRVLMFHMIIFPITVCILGIDVQLVLPPALGVMDRARPTASGLPLLFAAH